MSELPSVTQIIDDVYAKGIEFWRWRLRDEQAAIQKSQEAATKGTRIHSIVGKHAKGEPTRYPKAIRPLKDRFSDYLKGKTLVMSEEKLISPRLGFRGTPDWVYKDELGNLILEDFKTGKVGKLEHSLQLGGYLTLILDVKGYTLSKARIVQIKDNSILPCEWEDTTNCYFGWKHCYNLYKWKHGQI